MYFNIFFILAEDTGVFPPGEEGFLHLYDDLRPTTPYFHPLVKNTHGYCLVTKL